MKQINIIGIGIKGFEQITIEALNAIKNADKVFHLTLFDKEIRSLNKNCVSLVTNYVSSDSFDIYDSMVSEIMEATKNNENICVANYGHPSYLVNVTQTLINKSDELNILCKVIPGISSIDVIWSNLKKDSGFPGLQIIEANQLINNQLELNKKLDLFIPHITEFLVPFNRELKIVNYPKGIKSIKKYLLNYYTNEQELALIAISPLADIQDRTIITTLKNIDSEDNLKKYIRGMTLFIQGV